MNTNDAYKEITEDFLQTLYPGVEIGGQAADDRRMYQEYAMVELAFIEEGKDPVKDGLEVIRMALPLGQAAPDIDGWNALMGRVATRMGKVMGKVIRKATSDEYKAFAEAEKKAQEDAFFEQLLARMPAKERADA